MALIIRKLVLIVFEFAAASLAACDRIENAIHQWPGEPPNRRPGLWRLTVIRTRFPRPVVFLECIDRRSDADYPLFFRNKPPGCDRWSLVRRLDGFLVGDSVCSGVRSGFAISGDFESKLTIDDWRVLDRNDGQWRAGTILKRHSEWVYKGACPKSIPAGHEQRPDGDVVPIGTEVLH